MLKCLNLKAQRLQRLQRLFIIGDSLLLGLPQKTPILYHIIIDEIR